MEAKKRELFEKLRDSVVSFDIEGVQKAAKEALDAGIPPTEIISEGLKKGLDIVGEKYEKKEYFLAELIMAGETMKEAMKVIEPYMIGSGMRPSGRVVIGTVKGDLHDIGKNIVITLLKAAGFEVIDLGVDVPASRFVDEVKRAGRCILGMSALLSVSMPEMRTVINELKKAGLRDTTKVIIGGAVITEEFGRSIGADAAARDAVKGVEICKTWAGVT
jgi:5-methyltetrahydrofolate--homocysteine methyltransferase